VAKGSEQFAWKLFEGVPRICWKCGRELKVRADVGEHRTLYPSHKTQFKCKDCQREEIRARLEAQGTRKRS
jgi:hypothetical protein